MAPPSDFASLFENASNSVGHKARVRLEVGKQVEGTVLAISGGLVVLDVGALADATLDLAELEGREIQVGDRLRALVKNARIDGPELTLSLGRGGTSLNSATLEIALSSGTPVTGTVTAAVKGGFSVDLAGTRAFCPISQIDAGYVTDASMWVGQTLDFRVTEIREGGRNIIVSRRALLEAERAVQQSEALAQLEVGSSVRGTIKSVVKHGAVVDLGGVDGFIHISELARTRVERPEDVVSVGESVEVRVLTVERGDKGPTVRLSLKALATQTTVAPEVDEVLGGKVVGHVQSGVLVSTPKGDGLVPARELDLPPGADHKRAYPVGAELRVVALHRDGESGKLRLSVRKVADVEERKNYREFSRNEKSGAAMGSLGDVFAKKLKGSDEKALSRSRDR